MNREAHKLRRAKWLMTLAMIAGMALCYAAAYFILQVVYRFTGRPAELIEHVVAGLTGFFLFGMSIFVGTHIRGARRRGNRGGGEIMGTAIEAMNRIARGDFSVLVPVQTHSPFTELAQSINKMARELGAMENLRQDFISNVSHEIQSPLTSIGGFAALLRKDDLPAAQRAHYIDVIEAEARRLSKLSDNLLKLSSLQSGVQPLNHAPFSLDKQIQSIVLILEPQWAAKELDLSLALEKVTFSGDEELLSQVWINLIQNAVKFTFDKGEISITLSMQDGFAVCRISDTGPGISKEDQVHLFERFYKADKARDRALGGNGLGLSIAKAIVEKHGGTICVESELNKGSTFTVSLPMQK